MPKTAIIVLYTAAVLAMIGLVMLLLYFQSDTTARPSLQQPLPSELLKVLVLHGQWLFILANLVGIPWPATLMYPLQVSGTGVLLVTPCSHHDGVGPQQRASCLHWADGPAWLPAAAAGGCCCCLGIAGCGTASL
jgi:hypothetical protein